MERREYSKWASNYTIRSSENHGKLSNQDHIFFRDVRNLLYPKKLRKLGFFLVCRTEIRFFLLLLVSKGDKMGVFWGG
jgi:hypothetical protein